MHPADIMPAVDVVAAIKARLGSYEIQRTAAARRLRWRLPLFLVPVIAVSAFAAWRLYTSGAMSTDPELAFVLAVVAPLGLAIAHYWAKRPARQLQQSLRDSLLPVVFGFVEHVQYARGSKPATHDALPREAVGEFDREKAGDVISGTYRGFHFDVSETELIRDVGKRYRTIFKGIIVTFDLAARFPGVLVAARRANALTRLMDDSFGRLTQVETGNRELDAEIEFRSDNVEAAHRLLAGDLAATFAWLRQTWPDKVTRIALSGDCGFLLLPQPWDYFELPDIAVPVDYQAHIEPMIADFVLLLEAAARTRSGAAGSGMG